MRLSSGANAAQIPGLKVGLLVLIDRCRYLQLIHAHLRPQKLFPGLIRSRVSVKTSLNFLQPYPLPDAVLTSYPPTLPKHHAMQCPNATLSHKKISCINNSPSQTQTSPAPDNSSSQTPSPPSSSPHPERTTPAPPQTSDSSSSSPTDIHTAIGSHTAIPLSYLDHSASYYCSPPHP